jgi:hypothetical protein
VKSLKFVRLILRCYQLSHADNRPALAVSLKSCLGRAKASFRRSAKSKLRSLEPCLAPDVQDLAGQGLRVIGASRWETAFSESRFGDGVCLIGDRGVRSRAAWLRYQAMRLSIYSITWFAASTEIFLPL